MLKKIDCPICHAAGQVKATNSLGEIILDNDGLAFYKRCHRCKGNGSLLVDEDYEETEDNRIGNDDYRKEEEIEQATNSMFMR